MIAHAILAPSSLGTVIVCPGSLQLAAHYPEAPGEETQDALEGTAAHWGGSEQLEGRDVALGQVAPNNVVLTEEMLDSADAYVNAVRKVVPVGGQVEQRVDISVVHPFMWGTPDFWHYDPVQRTLHVADFKHGHRYVEVFECWQLIAYALGILNTLQLDGTIPNDLDVSVRFMIVQPRCYHRDGAARVWHTRAPDLRPYFATLTMAAYAAVTFEGQLVPNAPCVVNPGCLDCRGRHACPTLQRAALARVDLAGTPVPFDLPAEALGNELRVIERAIMLLEARQTGLKEQVKSLITRGETVRWYRLEQTQGREKWTRPPGEILALGSLMGVDLAKPTEAITPAQARKKGLDDALSRAYSGHPNAGLALVADDGKMLRKIFTA
jgi:hypothetical protein